MKKDGKYRFSLQFGSDSEKQVRAGEFLERLGKKKSIVVVEALNDYLLAHPELQEVRGRKIEVNVSQNNLVVLKNFTVEELHEIYWSALQGEWNVLLGEKPEGFDKLPLEKKHFWQKSCKRDFTNPIVVALYAYFPEWLRRKMDLQKQINNFYQGCSDREKEFCSIILNSVSAKEHKADFLLHHFYKKGR